MSSAPTSSGEDISSVASSVISGLSSITSNAATTTAPPESSPTGSVSGSSSSKGPEVYTVRAGRGNFEFDPAELKDVAVGDTITFEFYPRDHSVARAEYKSPCVPYEYTGKDRVGFWSDVQWVDTVDDITYWNLTINSTEPIFYYCAAPGSCIDHQMVGVINPNETQTLDAQVNAAKEASFMVKPGDPIPKEGSATLSATGLSNAPTSSSTAAPAPQGVHLSGGAIAGIVIGAVAFLALCAALFFYVGRTKSLKEMMHRKDGPATNPDPSNGHYAPPSQQPGSPGFPPAPFSPTHSHAEFGGQLPPYGQHNATDSHPSGWQSPPAQTAHYQPMSEVKFGHQPAVHEMASPQQNDFAAELEAPRSSQK